MQVQIWEIFIGSSNSDNLSNPNNSAIHMSEEKIIRSIVTGADFYVTAVEHSNNASIRNTNKSMTYIRALGEQADIGGHAGFVHNRLSKEVEGPLSINSVNEYMHKLQASKARDDPWTDFCSVVWKHKDGDAAPMFCFVQPPRTDSESPSMVMIIKIKFNSEERYKFEDSIFKQFLWLHGCYPPLVFFKAQLTTKFCVDVLKEVVGLAKRNCLQKTEFCCASSFATDGWTNACIKSTECTHMKTASFSELSIWSRSKKFCNKYSLK